MLPQMCGPTSNQVYIQEAYFTSPIENETIEAWKVAADPNSPCGAPGVNAICCAGNRAADPETHEFRENGRCIMSHQDAEGPRGFCPACLEHWQSLDNGSGVELTCDALYPGSEPIIDLAGAIVPARGVLRGVVAAERIQRRGFSSPPLTGEYRVRLLREGEVVYDEFVSPPFDHRSETPREAFIVHAQIPVLSGGSGMVTQVKLFRGDQFLSQTTLSGSPPEANAGANQLLECAEPGLTAVELDAGDSYDADGDTLSYEWYFNGAVVSEDVQNVLLLPVGEHEIFVRVDDGSEVDVDSVVVTIADGVGPVVTPPPDTFFASCTGVTPGAATVTDACGSTFEIYNDAPSSYKAGVTVVSWWAIDQFGNRSETKTQRLGVGLGDSSACCPTGTKIIQGTSNNDILNGTSGRDCIIGKGAQDTIKGFGGDDVLSGGDGNDTIEGGDGNDFIWGGPGQDSLKGQVGSDWIYANDGDDTCYGGTENDVLYGGQGQDNLYGEANDDSLFGESGNDLLDGAAGNDLLVGGSGTQDRCLGGTGTNTLMSCEL